MPYPLVTDELSPVIESVCLICSTEIRISLGPSCHVVEKDATLNLMRLLSTTSSVQLYMPEMTQRGHKLNPEPGGTKDKTREIIATLAATI